MKLANSMKISSVHEAKTNLSRLIQSAERGEEVLIARRNKPVVRLVAIAPAPKKRKLGIFHGEFEVGPGFFEPLPASELDAWEK